jgi:hypothetical protein
MNTEKCDKEIMNNIIESLRLLKYEISNIKSNYQISKKQNTDLDEYFAYKIIWFIKNSICSDNVGIASPFLYLTDDKNDGFDKGKLISLIENELNELQKRSLPRNIATKHYFDDFIERILFVVKQ